VVVFRPQRGIGRRRFALTSLTLAALLLALGAPAALGRDAFVGNEGDGTVSAVDLASGEVIGEPIAAEPGSGAIAITPDGKKAYVANHLADTVSAIDTESDEVVGEPIEVGEGPRGVAISPDGSRAYVGNEDSDTVSVIDTASDEVVAEIADVDGARGLAVSPDGKRLYVGQDESSTVSVIDTASDEVVGEPIVVGVNPQGIAFTPDGTRAYVANLGSASVSVIDTATENVIDTIPVESSPVGVDITPDGKLAYVTNTGADTVSVIDTETDSVVGEPIDVPTGPRGVAFSPDGSRAYVATGFFSASPGTVTAIDTASDEVVGEPTTIGNKPLGIAIVPDQPPLASLAPAVGAPGKPVQLDASASHDPDGQIARYDWSFGDGETAPDAGPMPTHTYRTPGIYLATVTLTDSEGCSTKFVFTGLTASCNGSSPAAATSTVWVAPPPSAPPPPPPSNDFHIRKLRRDKHSGIAKLTIWVPGPGALLIRGTHQVRAVKREVGQARNLTLTVRPSRKAAKALRRHGHLRVTAKITFRPDGGVPLTSIKRLALVRRAGGR
jgi:YVTN family beta-propeller protein